MSTILKALRRLEQDRNPLGSRPLREAVTSGDGSPARARRTRIAIVLVLGVCVVVGAGALAFFSVGQPPPAPQVAASAPAPSPRASRPARTPAKPAAAARHEKRARLLEERAARASAARSAAARATPAEPRGLAPEALASNVQVVKRPPPEPRLADPDAPSEAGTEKAARAARQEPAQRPALARADATPRRAEPAPNPAPARAAEPAAKPVPERTARKEPEPAPAAEPGAPEAASDASAPAPTIARAVIPSVHVEETRWHPDAARRTALVKVDGSSQQVREGDAVGPLVVSTIEPSGVVFSHDGIEMRRRVGE
jgi:hypothetical protein